MAPTRSPRPAGADPTGFARAPKQERSRRSFDKAIDAAVALVAERGSAGFTLAEVAQRAGVSVGSIYGRVDSKDDLLRAAHAREMTRIRAEQRAVFAVAAPDGESFAAAVRRVVDTTAQLLRANSGVLAPFMLISSHDPVIAAAGKTGYEELVEGFRAGLLARGADIRHPDPPRAVTWSCVVVYSVVARWLGLGSEAEAAGEGDWEQILADLADMVTSFLSRAVAVHE